MMKAIEQDWMSVKLWLWNHQFFLQWLVLGLWHCSHSPHCGRKRGITLSPKCKKSDSVRVQYMKGEMSPTTCLHVHNELYNLPGEKFVTSGPTLSTSPAPSWPRTNGNGLNLIPFPASYRYSWSVWHTPVATICPDRQGAVFMWHLSDQMVRIMPLGRKTYWDRGSEILPVTTQQCNLIKN